LSCISGISDVYLHEGVGIIKEKNEVKILQKKESRKKRLKKCRESWE
jgi:hypothetical protein